MIRLFTQHTKRKSVCLDGMWRFKTDPNGIGKKEKWYKHFPKEYDNALVPSCWNNELDLYHYEGVCWYNTSFVTAKENISLIFHGVTGTAEVYLDGELLGSHYGGYTGFSFELQGVEAGTHNLTVYVDNTHDSDSTIPLALVDWFHYGGIIRSVEMAELCDTWVKDVKIDYELNDSLTDANVSFKVVFGGAGKQSYDRTLNIYKDDVLICSKAVNINAETSFDISNIVLKDIKLWDTQSPNLYYFRFEIEDDDFTERIGFRTVTIKNRRIMLNNKEIQLKGVNRHEDHPDWGHSVPVKLMKKDLDIIKKMGCNTIRGSHYPNAPIFLDMCDEAGILFWEEIPMWGFPEKPLKNPLVLKRGLSMHREMVSRDYHHPCIIIWGMHNEIETFTEAAFDLTKRFAEQVRSLDSGRLITYATMHPLSDICYPLVDIVCVNAYLGWYGSALDEWPEFFKKLEAKLKKEKLSHMPVIMSEFGAGGIYGERALEQRKWTENYQAEYLDYTLTLFKGLDFVAGTYIWQYCDIRTPKENELSRPRSFNNKGVLNEYRQPKLAYWVVKQHYKQSK